MGSERTLEILRSRSQLEASLFFFWEIQIIKEYIILGSSVLYLLEFILQAVFYGKYWPKLSIDVFFCFVGLLESPKPRVQLKSYPYLCWNKGIIFRI